MELNKYQRLGITSFWVFVLSSSLPAIMGFFIFFFILVLKVAGLPDMIGPGADGTMALASSTDTILNWGLLGSFALMVLGAALAFFLGVIDYFSYSYILDDHDLRVRRGIIHIEESAIPYHGIEDVSVERPLLYRILGVSTLVIYTAATTAVEAGSDQAEGRLPALPKKLADEIREEIMRRSNIQEVVNVTSEHKNN